MNKLLIVPIMMAAGSAFLVFASQTNTNSQSPHGEIEKLRMQIAATSEESFKCGVVVAWSALRDNPGLFTNGPALVQESWQRYTNYIATHQR